MLPSKSTIFFLQGLPMTLVKDKQTPLQSLGEEIANSVTHAIGVILSIIGMVVLLRTSMARGTVWHTVSCSLYGAFLSFLYLSSTLYHAIFHERAKRVFRKLDHISIYLLIFGTYIPLTLVVLNGPLGWTIFGLECGLCVLGILFKIIYGHRFELLSLIFYLLMGWIGVFAVKPILDAISFQGLFWMLLGGLFYSLGVFFYTGSEKYPYFHAIWHVFVLLGSACHFFLILQYVIPFSV
jgi:hemolysin III